MAWTSLGTTLFGWVLVALFALFAFEANDLRGAALERRGYRLIGVAEGRGRTQAELSFFRAWLPQQGKSMRPAERGVERAREKESAAPPARGEGEEVIGLFPQA